MRWPADALVVTGHMATDSVGINRMIEGLEAQAIEAVRSSGVPLAR